MSEDEAVAAEAEAPAEDKGPKKAKKVTGVSKDAKITVVATSNIKREGSEAHKRFAGYLTDPAPTTVQEALDNGLTIGDIHYDLIHGSITVEGAEVIEYEISPRGPRGASDDADAEDGEEGEEGTEGDDDGF